MGVSPVGHDVFIAEGSVVERYERHADGRLSLRGSTPAPSGALAWALAVSPDGHDVYVTDRFSSGASGLWQLSLDPSGELEALTPPAVIQVVR